MISRTIPLVLASLVTFSCSSAPGEPVKAAYDIQTGNLQRLEVDSNHDGKIDTVSYMDGTRILRIELDLNENGKVERWDFYKADGELEKVGFASRDDGVMDSQAFYNADKSIARIEISTRRDGRFDRTEYYEHGVLTRSADDTNRDGRPDKWDNYRPQPGAHAGEPAYTIVSTEFDDSHSGRPERRFVYGPGGTIASVEVDPDGVGAWIPMTHRAAVTQASTQKR